MGLNPDLAFEIVMRRSKKLDRQGAKTILAEGILEYFDVKRFRATPHVELISSRNRFQLQDPG